MSYTYASNETIEIRVDLEQSTSQIQYRLLHLDDDVWIGTPFQRADIRFEEDALRTVDCWLESSREPEE